MLKECPFCLGWICTTKRRGLGQTGLQALAPLLSGVCVTEQENGAGSRQTFLLTSNY